jgi:hypothetical protein
MMSGPFSPLTPPQPQSYVVLCQCGETHQPREAWKTQGIFTDHDGDDDRITLHSPPPSDCVVRSWP